MAVVPLRLGKKGIAKQIHLGTREGELDTAYLRAFIDLARNFRLTTRDAARAGAHPA